MNQHPTATVPFVDLALQHRRIATDVKAAMEAVLDRTGFVLGEEVASFEQQFADYCGVRHCVGVGSGTDALELALRGVGVGPGDEVIIPANTFVATAEAVLRAGATLVLADCGDDYLVDPASVSERVTRRTKAVMPVHLYGQVAAVKAIRDAVGESVLLLEDAAQAQGATQGGERAGSLGAAAGTSFYPGKNLGAYGDAGAVLTDSDGVAERIRALRNHGGVRKYEHHVIGTNSRLDGLQAAVLSVKLAHLDAWNAERTAAAAVYDDMLADLHNVKRPVATPGNDHVWHLYVVRVRRRDQVLASMVEQGVGAGVHYPAPVHLLPAFSYLGSGVGSFPTAERLADEILSLPMFPGITIQQQEKVVLALRRAMA